MKKIAMWFATGFGLGLSPIAPGTAGTLIGVAIVWFSNPGLMSLSSNPMIGVLLQIAFAVVLSVVAIPICEVGEKQLGKKDPGAVVADEYFTFPICMIGLPTELWVLAVAFVSNRFFDILKPPPARKLQDLHGGFGIVIDDVFAALYSLAFNWTVYWVATRYLIGS